MRLELVTLVVRDYEEALAYYTGVLGFVLVEDTRLSETKRWIVVGRRDPRSASCSRADTAADSGPASGIKRVGASASSCTPTTSQANTHACARPACSSVANRRVEPYGTVVVFEDCYGNAWDLIETGSPAR